MSITDIYFSPPTVDLTQAWQRYVEYVRDGITVNLEFTRRWTDVVMASSEVAREQVTSLAEAAQGHGKAISTWIAGEALSIR
jgi:hypothetical protein